jgi:hypothetical protein
MEFTCPGRNVIQFAHFIPVAMKLPCACTVCEAGYSLHTIRVQRLTVSVRAVESCTVEQILLLGGACCGGRYLDECAGRVLTIVEVSILSLNGV